jgi:hypothetical protein
MARCQLWVPGLFDKQNVKLFTDNCKVASMNRYVCRTQCDVTLDTTIPETLANNTPVMRDCECHNCAVNQSRAVTGSSIEQSDYVFHASNTFSDECIDVVFEEPDTPFLQSVDIMHSQSYFEITESILSSELSMEVARNIQHSTCSYKDDNDSIWAPIESSVEVPSAVNVQPFDSDSQNDFSFPPLTEVMCERHWFYLPLIWNGIARCFQKLKSYRHISILEACQTLNYLPTPGMITMRVKCFQIQDIQLGPLVVLVRLKHSGQLILRGHHFLD